MLKWNVDASKNSKHGPLGIQVVLMEHEGKLLRIFPYSSCIKEFNEVEVFGKLKSYHF
jgi:hypothetical protein